MPPKTTRKKRVSKKDAILDSEDTTDVNTDTIPNVNTNDILNNDINNVVSDILESTNNNNKVDIDLTQDTIHVLEEPVVLQLAINPSRMDELISGEDIRSIMKYNPVITEPQPYCPENNFMSMNDNINETKVKEDYSQIKLPSQHCNIKTQKEENTYHDIKCYWCCHQIIDTEYGMPIRYDAFHSSFTTFGSFCSLQCAAAYNYSTNMGCNRVWEIHSWIQLLGKKYGFKESIRPAPSKYLLKLFNGNMDIDEFRKAHLTMAQTYITNIPPFIHINSQMDIINTSFLTKDKEKDKDKDKNKDKDKDRDKDRDKDKDNNRDNDKDNNRYNDKDNNRYNDKDNNKDNDKDKVKEKDNEKVKNKMNHDNINNYTQPMYNENNSFDNEFNKENANETQQVIHSVEVEKKKRASRTTKSSLEQKMNLIIT